MFVLLAALPYIAAIALYVMTAKDLVRDAEGEVPSNWNWKLVAPVVVGALTPLALAASDGVSTADRGVLLSVTGLAIVFGIVAMTAMRGQYAFFRLQRPVSLGRVKFTNVPRWKIIVGAGAVILCYGAVVNVLIAGKTHEGSTETKSAKEAAPQ